MADVGRAARATLARHTCRSLPRSSSPGSCFIGDRVMSRFGQTGIRVSMRIMGLMLAAVAVQFVITGVREAFLVVE